ncbi:MAG: hypothetical protein ACYDA3_03710 [Gaiellaceae bacterium]
MSTAPTPARPSELVAGFLAVLSIVASALALAYQPVKVIPFAAVLALIATAMAPRDSRLPIIAVFIAAICFAVGMTLAVTTNHALY